MNFLLCTCLCYSGWLLFKHKLLLDEHFNQYVYVYLWFEQIWKQHIANSSVLLTEDKTDKNMFYSVHYFLSADCSQTRILLLFSIISLMDNPPLCQHPHWDPPYTRTAQCSMSMPDQSKNLNEYANQRCMNACLITEHVFI